MGRAILREEVVQRLVIAVLIIQVQRIVHLQEAQAAQVATAVVLPLVVAVIVAVLLADLQVDHLADRVTEDNSQGQL